MVLKRTLNEYKSSDEPYDFYDFYVLNESLFYDFVEFCQLAKNIIGTSLPFFCVVQDNTFCKSLNFSWLLSSSRYEINVSDTFLSTYSGESFGKKYKLWKFIYFFDYNRVYHKDSVFINKNYVYILHNFVDGLYYSNIKESLSKRSSAVVSTLLFKGYDYVKKRI